MKWIKVIIGLLIVLPLGSWKPVESTGVKWLKFEEAIELHQKEPKKLLIDLYTDWCGWCKVMERETYSDEAISRYINANFYPVKFNAEQTDEVTFNGHTFKYIASGRGGVHELAAALTNNRLSYPTTVFMDEKLRIIQPISGYLKPQQMEPILLYIGNDHYMTTKWEDFEKSGKKTF